MKKLSGLVLCILLVLVAAAAMADVAINETNFPDANFRKCISQFDQNGNGVFDDAELKAVERIDCSDKAIGSLQGIEYFNSITNLTCSYNQLTRLDLSKNTALRGLSCDNNQLTTLNLSKNTALSMLQCFDNQLTHIDLSKNKELTMLDCGSNQLSTLDVM